VFPVSLLLVLVFVPFDLAHLLVVVGVLRVFSVVESFEGVPLINHLVHVFIFFYSLSLSLLQHYLFSAIFETLLLDFVGVNDQVVGQPP
jgi:hypothetical protein